MKIHHFTLTTVLLGLCATSAAAQNGATEISRTDNYGYYNDIWGYTAPNGDEYAIIGTDSGTVFYDVTNPSAPIFRKFINGPNSTWRDMKTFGDYCYIVTEGGGGMQIVDLTNPNNPTLVSTWGAGLFTHAHNIAIDLGTGFAYIVDSNPGVLVVDLNNPTAPVHIATYTAHDVHDAHIQNGFAHFAELHDGDYRIVSVSSLPAFPSQDKVQTPGNFTHNVWANETDTIAVTTDESNGGGLAFYDISNKSNIQFLSEWSNSNARVHNAMIKGDLVYCSWYSFGFGCIDISDPSNPQQIASFDSSNATGGGFDGTWGVYPFAASGLIYLSDQDNGLYIIQIDDPAMDLSGTASVPAGTSTNLNLSGAAPSSTWYLLFSFSNAGLNQFGTTFEVGAGWSLLTSGTTDASGNASYALNVPPGASGRTAYFEVATANGPVQTSNLFRLQVQ